MEIYRKSKVVVYHGKNNEIDICVDFLGKHIVYYHWLLLKRLISKQSTIMPYECKHVVRLLQCLRSLYQTIIFAPLTHKVIKEEVKEKNHLFCSFNLPMISEIGNCVIFNSIFLGHNLKPPDIFAELPLPISLTFMPGIGKLHPACHLFLYSPQAKDEWAGGWLADCWDWASDELPGWREGPRGTSDLLVEPAQSKDWRSLWPTDFSDEPVEAEQEQGLALYQKQI